MLKNQEIYEYSKHMYHVFRTDHHHLKNSEIKGTVKSEEENPTVGNNKHQCDCTSKVH